MASLRNYNQPTHITIGPIALEGSLTIPENAIGIVLFAHGSGSSRHSPRNQYVAEMIQAAGIGTLLIDLLTPAEESIDLRTKQLRFDIAFLAERIMGVTDWLVQHPDTCGLNIGYFGASTGAGGALVAAAKRQSIVRAVVLRGGRPDLATDALPLVQAPTLLIVGEKDPIVIDSNQQAMSLLYCEKHIEIIPQATHLFEEPGALTEVARLAGLWFQRHFLPPDELGPHLTNLDEDGNREELI